MPAKAGIHADTTWTPACAGVTISASFLPSARSGWTSAARGDKKAGRGFTRAGFPLPRIQFRSVTGLYPGSVTLSIPFYRSGQILQIWRASSHKTALFAASI